ncbi:MAG: hypothetical protein J5685_06155, partial [Clostridiales bacterium]|nr:hypothetical protein [Clostridiales bacterium]
QLKEELAKWNEIYKLPPRILDYPLKRRSESYLTKDLFFNSSCNQNPREVLKEFEYKGQYFRSKNEILACQALDALGYEFKSEIELRPDEFTCLYPDITFYVKEIEKPISLEVDGAMDKDSYFVKSETRKKQYLTSGLIEFKDVIFLQIFDAHAFDMSKLSTLITSAIIANVNDIVFPDL